MLQPGRTRRKQSKTESLNLPSSSAFTLQCKTTGLKLGFENLAPYACLRRLCLLMQTWKPLSDPQPGVVGFPQKPASVIPSFSRSVLQVATCARELSFFSSFLLSTGKSDSGRQSTCSEIRPGTITQRPFSPSVAYCLKRLAADTSADVVTLAERMTDQSLPLNPLYDNTCTLRCITALLCYNCYVVMLVFSSDGSGFT